MKNSFSLVMLCCIILMTTGFTKSQHRAEFLTNSQEEYFAAHPDAYAYFDQLYVRSKSPEQIGKEYHLSVKENVQYLSELARIGVIAKPNNNDLSQPIQFLVHGISQFKEKGALAKKFDQLMVKQTFEQIEKEMKAEKLKFIMPGFWLTEEQQQSFQQELNDLADKYISQSVQNRNSKDKDAHRVSGLIVLLPNWEPGVFSDIKPKQQ
jgi:hypothetical protein